MMAGSFRLIQIAWMLTILAFDGARAQRNTCPAGTASIGANCIHRQRKTYASPYCSSVLSVTTPTSTKTTTTLDTVFQNSTTTEVFTASGTPPITTTISDVTTINSTTTITRTSTTFTGTFTTYVDTTTITSTSISNVYTCGNIASTAASSSSSIPISSSAIPSSSSVLGPSSISISASSIPAGSSTPPMNSSSLPVSSSSMLMSSSSSAVGSSSGVIESSSVLIGSSSIAVGSSSSAVSSSSFVSKSIVATGTGISRPGSSISASASRPPFMNSSSVLPSGGVSGTGSISASITPSASLPYYYPPLAKRQTVTPIFFTPRCLRKYHKSYSDIGLTRACECLDIATPPPVISTVTTADPSNTVISQSTITVTSITTITPTRTATEYSTNTKSFSRFTTITEMAVSTASETYTITAVTTSTVTQSYPTPTSFNIYYTNSSSGDTNPPANFFKAIEAPGGSGIVLAPEAAADSFMLDSQDRLVDTTGGNAFITKNTDDLYPFELLQTTAATSNIPICSACNGVLQCDYPGTKGNTFALCYGYLALGPPDVFGKDSNGDGHIDCVPITLQFK